MNLKPIPEPRVSYITCTCGLVVHVRENIARCSCGEVWRVSVKTLEEVPSRKAALKPEAVRP